MDLLKLTALELGEKIKAKEVTVREAVDAVIGQIKEAESEIHSFVTIDEEGAYRCGRTDRSTCRSSGCSKR